MYWVTMTDKFMGNWKQAGKRKIKLVFECETYEEAAIVAQNADNRSDMNYINICSCKPRYSPQTKYMVQVKTKDDYPTWYKPNTFHGGAK